MLTGKRLFTGETVSDTLAAVLRQEIDWKVLPASTPPGLRRLLERCLDRDAKKRLRDIGEARIALEQTLGTPDTVRVSSGVRALPWALAGALAAGLAIALWAPWRTAPTPAPPLRLSAELGVAASLSTDLGPAAVLSPDRALLAFVASQGADGRQLLHIRRLDQLDAAPLSGTEGARDPFFSPDGEWIAFFADGKLKKVSVSGGRHALRRRVPPGRELGRGRDDLLCDHFERSFACVVCGRHAADPDDTRSGLPGGHPCLAPSPARGQVRLVHSGQRVQLRKREPRRAHARRRHEEGAASRRIIMVVTYRAAT